jgi:anti-sigma factor RsiW
MKILSSRLVCQQAVALMSDYVDGSLSRRDRRRLQKHLSECDACTAFLDQLRVTIAASTSINPDEVPPHVMDALTDVFRKYHSEE